MAQEKPWSKLDHSSKLERITTLWNKGLSDAQIADTLSASKGQIVGYRHQHLPKVTAATRGRPELQSGGDTAPRTQVPSKPRSGTRATPNVARKRTQPEKDPPPPPQPLPKEQRMQHNKSRLIAEPAGAPSEGFVGKMTSDWNKQCGHRDKGDGKQCGFHFTVQSGSEKRCNMHAHEIQ